MMAGKHWTPDNAHRVGLRIKAHLAERPLTALALAKRYNDTAPVTLRMEKRQLRSFIKRYLKDDVQEIDGEPHLFALRGTVQ